MNSDDWFVVRKALITTLLKAETNDQSYRNKMIDYFMSLLVTRLQLEDVSFPRNVVQSLLSSNRSLVNDGVFHVIKKFKYTALVSGLFNLFLLIYEYKHGNVEGVMMHFDDLNSDDKYRFVFKITWFMAFCVSVDILSTFPVLDKKVWTMSVDDFKNAIKDFKQMSELSNIPCIFVGLEQCCGIQKYISYEDKMQYVQNWLLKQKDHLRTVDIGLFRMILRHLFKCKPGYDWRKNLKTICANPEFELASGSLQLAKNMSIAKDNKKRLKNIGYRVASKKGLGLLIPADELEKCVLDEKLEHDIIVTSASDYNKVRFIASADVISFIRQKLIYDGLEYNVDSANVAQRPLIINGIKFYISIASYNDQAINFTNNSGPQTKIGPFMLPLDFSTFDFNPNRKELNMVLRELGLLVNALDISEMLIYGDVNGYVIVDGNKVGRHCSGLPSGWLLTSLFGSLMNIYWNIRAILLHKPTTVNNTAPRYNINVLGDDVDMSSNLTLQSYVELVKIYSKELNLTLHPEKMSYRVIRSEFLRTTTVVPCQYLARAIHSLIQRNEKNASAIFESLQGTRSQISEVLNKYNNIILRNGLTMTDGLKWMMQLELEQIRSGLRNTKRDAFYAFLRLPRFDGGCGCALNLADVDFRRQFEVTIKAPIVDVKQYKDVNVIGLDTHRFETILKFGAIEREGGLKFAFIWKDKTIKIIPNNVMKYYSRGYADFVERAIISSQFGYRSMSNIITGFDVTFWNGRVRELLASGLNEKDIVEKLRLFGMRRATAKMLAKSQIIDGDIITFVFNGILGNACSSLLSRLTVGSETLMRQMTAWLYNLRPTTGVSLCINY